jgi:hypothetical protein
VQPQLTVAPDVTVPLPPPSTPAPRRRPRRGASRSTSPRPGVAKGQVRGPGRGSVTNHRDDHERRLRMEHDAALRSRDAAVVELQAAKRECERLRRERQEALTAHEAALVERSASIEADVRLRVDELRLEVERERAGAHLAAQAARERDETRVACDEAIRERERACAESDDAQRARNRMLAERDTARARAEELIRRWERTAGLGTQRTLERDATAFERDRLAHECAVARKERDAIARARDAAVDERDRIAHELHTGVEPAGVVTEAPTLVLTERELLGPEVRPLVTERAPRMPRARPPEHRREAGEAGCEPRAVGALAARPHDAVDVWRVRLFALSALLVAVVVLVALLLTH